MWGWLTEHWSEIVSFVGGLAGGSLLTFSAQKIYNRNRIQVDHSFMVNQSGARANGDVVGRNKTTTTHRR